VPARWFWQEINHKINCLDYEVVKFECALSETRCRRSAIVFQAGLPLAEGPEGGKSNIRAQRSAEIAAVEDCVGVPARPLWVKWFGAKTEGVFRPLVIMTTLGATAST